MLAIRNTENSFGIVAIILHWIMAIIIIGLLGLGLYMTRIPISLEKLKLFGWHKEWGMVALFLFFLRSIWRILNKSPSLAELPFLEKIAARTAHFTFYIFMFALPLTGWLITSSAGLPVSVFGLVLPDLVSPNEENRLWFQTLHEWLSYFLIASLCLHSAAALKHHFINKDLILRRMLWPE